MHLVLGILNTFIYYQSYLHPHRSLGELPWNNLSCMNNLENTPTVPFRLLPLVELTVKLFPQYGTRPVPEHLRPTCLTVGTNFMEAGRNGKAGMVQWSNQTPWDRQTLLNSSN